MAKVESVLGVAGELKVNRDKRTAVKLSRVGKLLANEELMEELYTYAAGGASLATIEGALGLKEGCLKAWCEKGKQRAPESKSLYRKLYDILRKAIAESRLLAENKMRERSPEVWLERNSAACVLERVERPNELLEQSQARLSVGTEFIEALKVLRAQGYDLNQVIDGGKVSLIGQVVEE